MKSRTLIAAAVLAALAGSAAAQVAINQTKAMAGGVTPGDAPGFPVTIYQPGVYRLTSDLDVPQGKAGVQILSGFVTLDLNGYSIRSMNNCTFNASNLLVACPVPNNSNHHGVYSAHHHSVIRNGRIYGFQGHGILGTGGERLEDLTVYMNGRNGYHGVLNNAAVPRPGHVVGSRFYSNGDRGALVRNTLVERSQFSYNFQPGLSAHGGTIIDSTFVGNQGGGLSVLDPLLPTTIKGSTWHNSNMAAPISGPGQFRSLGGNFDGNGVL